MDELSRLVEANRAYRASGSREAGHPPRPARGLAVLTCMDVRLDLFQTLGLTVGDAHLLRNAGGRASPDALRSLVLSTHLLGTREIGVIHHTECALEGLTDEEVARKTGVTGLEFMGFPDLDNSVRNDVETIRSCGYLPSEVTIWGAVYEVDSGAIRVVTPPLAVSAPLGTQT